jgi:hypothetical protein
MNELIAKVRILAKAETILARMRMRTMARQAALVMAAALFGLLALAMLNVALYLYLANLSGPAPAALAVAGLDVALAMIAVVAAGRLELDPEVKEAESLRDLALSELSAEADHLRIQIDELGHDIKRIRTAVTGITQPGGISQSMVFQWLIMLINYVFRKRG